MVTTLSEDKGKVLMLNTTLGGSAASCCPKEVHDKLLSSVGILLFMAVKQVGGLSLYKVGRWVKCPFLLLLIPRVLFSSYSKK